MNKLRLDLDALTVESFNTTGGDAVQRGTVEAHAPNTQFESCYPSDCCPIETDFCSGVSDCGTCATGCGTCYDATCGATYCGTCETNCGTCDPYCCCSCSCC